MPTNIVMPQMGESIFEGTITKWLKKEGDPVLRDEDLFEISTDKVDSVIPSPVGGVLQKVIIREGATVPIHTVVAIIGESSAVPVAAAVQSPALKAAAPAEAGPEGEEDRIFSSPLVRRIAEREGIDLGGVQGTGWKGRITKKDIMDFLEGKAPVAPAPAPAPVAAAPPVPVALPPERADVVALSAMRTKIAEHMVHSRRTSAHVTTVFEVDVERIAELREREREDYEIVYGTKLSFTPFFATACVRAIRDFPVLNASMQGNDIAYHKEVNLGIAVALPDGLIVPVVKKAEEKSFLGLARSIQDLAERARSKRLTVDEVKGGTFTVTNPGIFGSLFGTPIINQPQVAILDIGTIEKRPVVIDDAIAIRSRCYLALSFDHRLVDGAVADQFMSRVKEILQTWNVPIK